MKEYYRHYHAKYVKKDKIKVFQAYSPDLTCQHCGFTDLRALSIDHIKGGGTQDRKIRSGYALYRWLIKNNFPEGFQVLCMNCQFIKRVENNEAQGMPRKPRYAQLIPFKKSRKYG